VIGKLLGIMVSLITALCVATVIAGAILAVYYSQAWHLDRERLLRALADLRGENPESPPESPAKGRDDTPPEQVSYSQVLEARAMKARDIELRLQSLRSGKEQLQFEQHKVADETIQLKRARDEFHSQLATMQKTEVAAGREQARLTLETLKPKQAKELMAQMLEKNEIDDVVMLLSGMSEGKRAKIMAEFKSTSEAEQIGEVLRRIRLGLPTASVAEKTEKQLEPPKGPGP
jgi:hypothetical protein